MKRRFLAMMVIATCFTCIYAQNNDGPVLDYETIAGNDHIHPLLKQGTTAKEQQKERIRQLTKEAKQKSKSKNINRYLAERDINDSIKGSGVGYTISEELRKEYIFLIKNAKWNKEWLRAVYKENGKMVERDFMVYITHETITPWLSTRDPYEMYDKLPCDRKKGIFYMSQYAWDTYVNPNSPFKKKIEQRIKAAIRDGEKIAK